jgi:hypothetical protein
MKLHLQTRERQEPTRDTDQALLNRDRWTALLKAAHFHGLCRAYSRPIQI